jgi:hypothetical protein
VRRRMTLAAIGAALIVGAGLAGMSLAGSDELTIERPAAEQAVLEPVTATERAHGAGDIDSRRGRGGPVINYFYSSSPVAPGFVQPIRCPRRAGSPIGGGARTSQLVTISYLSRAHPQTGNTPARTYFVGVDALPGADPEANAFIEVQCAKGVRVKD